MKKALPALLAAGLVALACSSKPDNSGPAISQKDDPSGAQATSGALPAWQKGYLDIHFINSGRGECAFFILPDGTQMLVDAGASTIPENYGTNLGYPQTGIAPKPNGTKVAGAWYAAYISKCMGWTGNKVIDYAVNTHFDGDHLGVGYENYGVSLPKSPNGNWFQSGITYLMDSFSFGTMLDHGYPDYNYPVEQSGTVLTNCSNYRKCADWHQQHSGLRRELFKAGTDKQITLTRDAAAYPEFSIRNLSVNGEFWTGSGSSTMQLFPDRASFSGSGGAKEYSPSENSCSCTFRLSYGKFDYYGGGDSGVNGYTSYAWKNTEAQLAKVCGAVEVMKATHHGSADACSQTLLSALAPQDIIVNVWQAVQPRADTFKRMCSSATSGGSARIYTTNINKAYMADNYGSDASRILASSGHIVVRVNPGGGSYCIYQLQDTDIAMGMKIIKAFGPYNSR